MKLNKIANSKSVQSDHNQVELNVLKPGQKQKVADSSESSEEDSDLVNV